MTITPDSLSTWWTRDIMMYSGMIRAASGTICTPRITTMNGLRP
jgi:hypothetical protein